jgi:2-dehydro-3-deoxygluconokinase
VVYYRAGGPGSRLSILDVPLARIADAALLHVTGISVSLSPSAHDAVFAAVREAKAAGIPVSFDVNHRPSLWTARDPAPVYRELVAQADIVFAGDDEAGIVIPGVASPTELARGLAELGPDQVIIKLGARGCAALIDGVAHERDALPITPVDTVGAGDAFVAGYLAEFVAGLDAATRLTTATAAGAFACLHLGDWEGLPTRPELAA